MSNIDEMLNDILKTQTAEVKQDQQRAIEETSTMLDPFASLNDEVVSMTAEHMNTQVSQPTGFEEVEDSKTVADFEKDGIIFQEDEGYDFTTGEKIKRIPGAVIEEVKAGVRGRLMGLAGVEQGAEAKAERFQRGRRAEIAKLQKTLGQEDMYDRSEDRVGYQASNIGRIIADKTQEHFEADPDFEISSGFVEKQIRSLTQVGTQVLVTALGGPIAGMTDMGLFIVGSSFENWSQDPEADPERVLMGSVINAGLQAPMEQFSINKVVKMWKAAGVPGKIVQDLTAAFGSEWGTEFIQNIGPERIMDIWVKNPELSFTDMAKLYKKTVLDNPKVLEEDAVEAFHAALSSLIIGAPGAHRRAKRELEEEQAGKKAESTGGVTGTWETDPTQDEMAALNYMEEVAGVKEVEAKKEAARLKRIERKKKKAEEKAKQPPKEVTPNGSTKSESETSTTGDKEDSGKAGDRFSPDIAQTEDTTTTPTEVKKPEETVPAKPKAGDRFAPKVEETETTTEATEEVTSNVPNFKNQVDAVAWAKENQDSLPDIRTKLQEVSKRLEQETDLEKKMELAYQQDALRHAEAIAQGKGTLYEQIKKRDAEMAAEKQRQEKAKADEAEKQRQQALQNKKEQTAATLAQKKAEAEAAYKAKLKAGEIVEADKKPAAKDLATTGLLTESGELITGDLDIEGLSPSQFSTQQAEDLVESFNQIKKKWPNHWRNAKKVLVTKDGRYISLSQYVEKAKLIDKVINKQKDPDVTNRVKDAAAARQKQINDMFRKEEVLPLTDKEQSELTAMLKKGSAWDNKLDAVAKILGDDTDQIKDYKAAAQLALTEHFSKGKDMNKFDPMLAAKKLYNEQYRGEGLGAAASGVRRGKLTGTATEEMADVESANPMAEGTKRVKQAIKPEKLDEGQGLGAREAVTSAEEYDREQEVLDIVQKMNVKLKRNPQYKPTSKELLARAELLKGVKGKAKLSTKMQKRDMDLIRDESAKQAQDEKVRNDWHDRIENGGWQDMLGREVEIEQVGEFDPNNPKSMKLIYKVVDRQDPAYLTKKQRDQKLIEMAHLLDESIGGIAQGAKEVVMYEEQADGTLEIKTRLNTRSSMLRDLADIVRRKKVATTRKERWEESHNTNFFQFVPVSGSGDSVTWGWVFKPQAGVTQAEIKQMSPKERAYHDSVVSRMNDAMRHADRMQTLRQKLEDGKVNPIARRAMQKELNKLVEASIKNQERAKEIQRKYDLAHKQRIVAEFVKEANKALEKSEKVAKKESEDLEMKQLLELDRSSLQNMLRVTRNKAQLSKIAKALRIQKRKLIEKGGSETTTAINRTKGTRIETTTKVGSAPKVKTVAQQKIAESKKVRAEAAAESTGDRFAPVLPETKAEPKAEPEIKSSYTGILPGAGKRFKPDLTPETKAQDVEKAAAENIAEAETTLPKAPKKKAGNRFGVAHLVDNKRGGMEMEFPGREQILSIPNRVTQAWMDKYDRASAKMGKLVVSAARANSLVDGLLTGIVSKFGVSRDFKQMREDYDLQIHKNRMIASALGNAINQIGVGFKSEAIGTGKFAGRATTRSFDAMAQTLNRLTTGALNPVHKPRSAKSQKNMLSALEKRKQQIAEGSITMFPEKYKAVRRANEKFEELERELVARGLLSDHQFRQLTNKERAKAINEVREIDTKIATLRGQALPEAKRNKAIKKLEDNQRKILTRLQVHYKNSGVNYLRHIRDQIDQTERYRKRLSKDALTKGYAKRRQNWRISVSETDGRLIVKRVKAKGLKNVSDLVTKGVSQEAHDMHMWDLFKNIAEYSAEGKGVKILEGNIEVPWASEHEEDFTDLGVKPKRVPKVDAFGPLAGMYVEPHIYAEMSASFEQQAEWRKQLRKVFSTWKAGKTVYNPATVTRNAISNMVLANVIGGVNILRPKVWKQYVELGRDIISIKRGEIPKSKYGREVMMETTIMADSFVRSEFGDGDLIAQGLNKLADLSPFEATAKLTKLAAKAPEFYDFLETSMKALVYANAREKGMDSVEAAALAEEALFDYNDIPPAIRWARRYYSPFVTFTYKALPAIAKAHVRTPWRLIPYYAGALLADEMAGKLLGDDEEEQERKRRLLPEYVRRSAGFMPSHIRMPFQTPDGKDKYLDLSYMLPWGDMTRMEEGPLSWMPSFLAPSTPLLTVPAQMLMNQDLFTAQPIIMDTDSSGELALKTFKKIWDETAPAVMSSYKFKKMIGAIYGDKNKYSSGQKYSVYDATVDWLFGIKFRNMDFMEQSMYRNQELQKKASELQGKYTKKLERVYHMQSGRYSEDAQRKATEKVYQDMAEDMDELQEEFLYRFMMESERE